MEWVLLCVDFLYFFCLFRDVGIGIWREIVWWWVRRSFNGNSVMGRKGGASVIKIVLVRYIKELKIGC